ncbi:hypothetical protein U8527_20515 [Kordia algicida OT-1]|uniref:Uncharacterized protein n=1 Tax=Kordia algicida OT-1 TaxID=391587 RepID=A9DKR6_9FLAO|nr:hypothetical protein [Kordia algicida]EDP98385.1 hypothetical protein KAOT1_14247 [Kordia algicida OT-1]
MHKELVLRTFDKARKEVKEATGANMSVTGLSKQISDFLMEECRFQYHEKSLRNKYNLAKKGDTVALKSSVANCLCRYLGYDSYAAFIRKNTSEEITTEISEDVTIAHEAQVERKINKGATMGEKLKIIIQKNKVTLIFSLIFFCTFFKVMNA